MTTPVDDERVAFLQAIRAAPDDDGPRLVYADWLQQRDEPRGEFIVVQCELARAPRPDLEARQTELLAQHGSIWLSEPQMAFTGMFRRGFVDGVTVGAFAGTARGFEALDRVEPVLRGITIDFTIDFHAPHNVLGLLRSPAIAGVTRFVLDGARRPIVHHEYHFSDGEMGPYDGTDGITTTGGETYANDIAEALAASPTLRPRELSLRNGGLTAEACALVPVAAPFGQLTVLRLGANPIGSMGVRALVADRGLSQLGELDLASCGLDAFGAGVLAEARWLPALEILDVSSNGLGAGELRRLLESPALPRLATLIARDSRLTDADRAALLARHGDRLVL